MIDSKIMETTKSILKDFGNIYFSDKGTLKRNKVIEDLDAYTPTFMHQDNTSFIVCVGTSMISVFFRI